MMLQPSSTVFILMPTEATKEFWKQYLYLKIMQQDAYKQNYIMGNNRKWRPSPFYLIYVEILIRYEFLNDESDDGCLTAETGRSICFIHNKDIYTCCLSDGIFSIYLFNTGQLAQWLPKLPKLETFKLVHDYFKQK
jgi:hypothetical protein